MHSLIGLTETYETRKCTRAKIISKFKIHVCDIQIKVESTVIIVKNPVTVFLPRGCLIIDFIEYTGSDNVLLRRF